MDTKTFYSGEFTCGFEVLKWILVCRYRYIQLSLLCESKKTTEDAFLVR